MSLIPVDEALARILAGVRPLPAEMETLEAADGRTLAADLAALRSQPPIAVSAMDGYALRAVDAWADAALSYGQEGGLTDEDVVEGAPGIAARAVDALLGVRL